MQPQVALVYNSRAGNGVAGVGWTLAAGSSIYRCPRTVAQDGETRGVSFETFDRLCRPEPARRWRGSCAGSSMPLSADPDNTTCAPRPAITTHFL
jgi:hypothetical protein